MIANSFYTRPPDIRPALTDSQVGSVVERIEANWGPGNRLDFTTEQMAALLHALFPDTFAGDEEATRDAARAVREGANGERPRPNGYRRPGAVAGGKYPTRGGDRGGDGDGEGEGGDGAGEPAGGRPVAYAGPRRQGQTY